MSITEDEFLEQCYVFGLLGGTNPPPGPSFSPALSKFVAQNGLNTLPGTRNEPYADPAYAIAQISGAIPTAAWGIQVAPGSYNVTDLALKPEITIQGDISALPVLNVTNPVTLDSSFASKIGNIATIQNMYINAVLNLDFSAQASSSDNSFTAYESSFLQNVTLTGSAAVGTPIGIFRSCYFSQNITLKSCSARFTNCYLLSNLTVQQSLANGNATLEWFGGNIQGAVSLTGDAANVMTVRFRGTRLHGTITITGTFVNVELDSGSYPEGGIVYAGGATQAQVTVYRAPYINTTPQHIKYVDQNGSDTTGTGDSSLPWATVSHALANITGAASNNQYLIYVTGAINDVGTIGLKPWVHVYFESGSSLGGSTVTLDSSWTAGGQVNLTGEGVINSAVTLDFFAVGGIASATVNLSVPVAGNIIFTSRDAGAGAPRDTFFLFNTRFTGANIQIKGGTFVTIGNYFAGNVIVNNGAGNAVNAIWTAQADIYVSAANVQLSNTGSNTVVATFTSCSQPNAGTATGSGVTWNMDNSSWRLPTITSATVNCKFNGATAPANAMLSTDGSGRPDYRTTLPAGIAVTSVTFTGDGVVLSSTPSSPVTSTGTLTATLKTQSPNQVFAGPTSGGAAAPTFRALVAADLPSLSGSYASLSGNNAFTGQNTITPAAITSAGGSTAWNLNTAPNATYAAVENSVLQNPTNAIAGTYYTLKFVQNATAAKTFAFNTGYKFPGAVIPTVSTGLGAIDIFTFYYDGTNMLCVGIAQNIS